MPEPPQALSSVNQARRAPNSTEVMGRGMAQGPKCSDAMRSEHTSGSGEAAAMLQVLDFCWVSKRKRRGAAWREKTKLARPKRHVL